MDGVLYRKWESDCGGYVTYKLVLPDSMREEVLSQIHSGAVGGHLGVKKTIMKVQQRFYWCGYHKFISEWCRKCDLCHSRKKPNKTHRAPMQKYNVGLPLERVAMDILGPLPQTNSGNKYVLVVSDYFTKWTEAYAIPNQEAMTVAKVFVEEFVMRFGVPRLLHTDQGRNFESELFKELCELLGICKTRTTAFHPQSDGMVERFNKTLEAMLSTVVSDNQKDWDEWLPYVMMAYRSSVHETTSHTPCLMMFGREMNLPIDIMFPPPPHETRDANPSEYVQKLQSSLETVFDVARDKTETSVNRQKMNYDIHSNYKVFNSGDKVWLFTPTRKKGLSPKLQRFWDGPYIVKDKLSDVTYRIKKSQRSKPKVVHHDRLKLYTKGGNSVVTRDSRCCDVGCQTDHFQPISSDRSLSDRNSVVKTGDPMLEDKGDSATAVVTTNERHGRLGRGQRIRRPPRRYADSSG